MSELTDEQLRDQQSFYDAGWRGELDRGKEQRGNLQANLEFLARTNLLRPGDRILEIGCGIGTVVFELSRQGYDVTGTDISQVAIEYGRAKYSGIRLEALPAEELPFDDGTFDVVLSFDLFEHIARIDRHVSEVQRVLKSGGYYLFQTPNKLSNVVAETLAHKSLEVAPSAPVAAHARAVAATAGPAWIRGPAGQNGDERVHAGQAAKARPCGTLGRADRFHEAAAGVADQPVRGGPKDRLSMPTPYVGRAPGRLECPPSGGQRKSDPRRRGTPNG